MPWNRSLPMHSIIARAKKLARQVHPDAGMITLELAIGIATFITVLLLAVAALASLGAYISAVDIAGAAARAYAVGQPYSPPRGEVQVHEDASLVYVTAKVPTVGFSMEATAIYPKQQPSY